MSKSIVSRNEFVIKFANVNGSGSASANRLLAKSILRMGVPVNPRNIFPSNIQGLPTWYEVRVSQAGYRGRRGGVDLMVAMNPQTWDQDVSSIEPGGYLLYDSTRGHCKKVIAAYGRSERSLNLRLRICLSAAERLV
jgi:2-oxoglutarate/2-oxoacid ferredoxin oxidoreductase subunit alpha